MAVDFFAGCLGGAVGLSVTHPFDTMKVRLQTEQKGTRGSYAGMWDCARSIVRKEGARGLFKGVTSPLCMVAVSNSIVFGVEGSCVRSMPNPNSFCAHFLGGFTAGWVLCFFRTPMELAKIRLQMQGKGLSRQHEIREGSRKYLNIVQSLVHVWRTEGFRSLYRGYSAMWIRDTPGYGLYFGAFHYFTTQTQRFYPGRDIPAWTVLLCGGFSGLVSYIPVYPADVVKSRYQALEGKPSRAALWICVKSVYKERGSMFRGLQPLLFYVFIQDAIIFMVVTYTLRWWKLYQTENWRLDRTLFQDMVVEHQGRLS